MSDRALCEVKCDRCGNTSIVAADLVDDRIVPAVYPENWSGVHQHKWKVHGPNKFDLCRACALDFENWMKLRDPIGRPLPCRHAGCTHTANVDTKTPYCMNHINDDNE